MNLPNNYSRCRGEFGFAWQKDAEPCSKRQDCLRHMQTFFDTQAWYPVIPHCIDGNAFIPLDAFKEDDE